VAHKQTSQEGLDTAVTSKPSSATAAIGGSKLQYFTVPKFQTHAAFKIMPL